MCDDPAVDKIPTTVLFRCLLCGGRSFAAKYMVRDIMFGLAGEYPVVECRKCSFMFTNPRPAQGALGVYYPSEYGPYHKSIHVSHRGDSSSSIAERLRSNALSGRLLGTFQNFGTWVPILPPGARALDVGCANGDFLLSLESRQWDLYGVELAEEPAAYARDALGLNVHSGTLEDAQFPEAAFDVVFAFMVVEHLADPIATISEVKRILRPDGYFVFSVPNAGSWQLKLFRESWRPLEVPRHLSHFTSKTVRILLEKSGLTLERIIFQRSVSDIFVTIGYWLRNRNLLKRLGTRLIDFPKTRGLVLRVLLLPFEWVEARAHQSSRMTVIARKR